MKGPLLEQDAHDPDPLLERFMANVESVGTATALVDNETRISFADLNIKADRIAAGLGAALLVSLVEVALLRYSYPTTFILYLSVALSPLLFSTPASKSS